MKKLLKTAAGAMALAVMLSAGSGFAYCGEFGVQGNPCAGKCKKPNGRAGSCGQVGVIQETGLPNCVCS